MNITIDLDDASINGLKTLMNRQYKDCTIEMVASQLISRSLKEMGYVIDSSQSGTSPENLNSSNDD